VWIRCADGELVRWDAITWLRCFGGDVEAACPDGTGIRLAGPGCLSDFDVALLRELESAGRWHDDRWVVIVSAEITADAARWVSAQRDEIAQASGKRDYSPLSAGRLPGPVEPGVASGARG
jgi:hypothetical protein